MIGPLSVYIINPISRTALKSPKRTELLVTSACSAPKKEPTIACVDSCKAYELPNIMEAIAMTVGVLYGFNVNVHLSFTLSKCSTCHSITDQPPVVEPLSKLVLPSI